jgi:putative membrane protein
MSTNRPEGVDREPLIYAVVLLVAMIALAISPSADRLTWLLETVPVMVALPLLVTTYRRFPLTPLAYRLIFAHALVLMIGGHYTYAKVPLGDWVKDLFELRRNPYDRLGHFMQGFVPALLAREILLRRTPLKRGPWLVFLVLSIALAISAVYELIEWAAALAAGEAADAFLGTQGDQWDTQWDMFLALVGASASQLLLAATHDRQLSGMGMGDPGRTAHASV